jgi:hypothetical protein
MGQSANKESDCAVISEDAKCNEQNKPITGVRMAGIKPLELAVCNPTEKHRSTLGAGAKVVGT